MLAFLRRLVGSRDVPDSEGPTRWVSARSLHPGPIQHGTLNERQLRQVKFVHDTFAELDGLSINDRIENFQRDVYVDRELSLAVVMANAYRTYSGSRELSSAAKMDVYRVLLLRSMAPAQEVLKRVQLEEISEADAVEVMNLFASGTRAGRL
jgi:hypothetical protein